MFEKIFESLKAVKLHGGVFGKTSLICIALIVGVSTVCLKIGVGWIALVLMILMMFVVIYAIKRLMDFAEDNPFAAIMDGAELLQHERIVHETKQQGRVEHLTPTLDHLPNALDKSSDFDIDQPALRSERRQEEQE